MSLRREFKDTVQARVNSRSIERAPLGWPTLGVFVLPPSEIIQASPPLQASTGSNNWAPADSREGRTCASDLTNPCRDAPEFLNPAAAWM